MIYTSIPTVDHVTFDELRAIDDDGAFVKDLVVLFEEHSAKSVLELRAAFDSKDLVEVHRIAHRLKGAALSLGASQLAALAGEIEHDDNRTTLGVAVNAIESLFLDTVSEFTRLAQQKV